MSSPADPQPAAQQSGTGQPAAQQPTAQQPAAQQPTAQRPRGFAPRGVHPFVRRILGPMSRNHVRLFRATGGRIGARLAGKDICLLTTTGRKSGLPRTQALICVPDGESIMLVAAQGGLPRHPAWLHNLRANPQVRVETRGAARTMTAREATEDERAELWPRLISVYSGWARYQSWTDRIIPVVICEPI